MEADQVPPRPTYPDLMRGLHDLLSQANAAAHPRTPHSYHDMPVPYWDREALATREQLARFTYKPGWRFEVIGNYLRITLSTQDTYNPHKTVEVCSVTPVYALGVDDPDMFAQRLAHRIQEMEIHESREWLRRDGEIFDNPHDNDR